MTNIKRYDGNGEIATASLPVAIDHVNAATRPFRDMLTRLETGRWAVDQRQLSLQASELDQDIAEAESVLLILLQNAQKLGGRYGQDVA